MVRRRPELVAQVYTPAEQQVFYAQPDPLPHFAAAFAVKEAAFKALGRGWLESALFWKDIELLTPVSVVPPCIRLSGPAEARLAELEGAHCVASLSHCGGFVVAQ